VYVEPDYKVRVKLSVRVFTAVRSHPGAFCVPHHAEVVKITDISEESVKAVFWTFSIVYGPGPGLRLPQPGGPTARFSVLPFYLKTEEDPPSETY
jgi:hypothetical protein